MIHSTLQILWIALPLGSWIINLVLPRRLHLAFLYVTVCIVGYLLLVTSVITLDYHLESELDKFDLNGDGGFDDSEMTPEAQQAMDNVTRDTGRTFAPVFGAPITAIWVLLNFAILSCGEWVFRLVIDNQKKTTEKSSSEIRDIDRTDPNPFRPPNS